MHIRGELFIEDIHDLHRAIGSTVLIQPRKLKGKEIRFIRHFMDLSQKAVGILLGVDYQTVHRWETGKIKITKTADRLLRVIFQEYLIPDSKACELIQSLSDLDNNRTENKIQMAHGKNKWKEAA